MTTVDATGYDRAVSAWLARAWAAADALDHQSVFLAAFITRGNGTAELTGIRTSRTNGGEPIRVDVVDLANEVDATGTRYAALVRGTTRKHQRADEGPWRYIGRNLHVLNAADPALADEVVAAVWTLHKAVSRIVDPPTGRRPRHLGGEICPMCGADSLWLDASGDPADWSIRCSVPECRNVWTVDQPILETAVTES